MPAVQMPEAFRFLLDPPLGSVRHRYAWGGRGSAKSHSFATALVLLAASRPLRVLCAREIQNSLRESVKALLEDKMKALGLLGFFKPVEAEIRGANGSQFGFVGLWSRPDSIKGYEGADVAWVEEAATVSERSIDLLRNTVRKPGSELWWTWNPRFEKDPIDKMFRGAEPPNRAIGGRVNWDQNPWFPAELREEMEWDRRRDPSKYAHIWLGEYQQNAEARVFKNWRVEAFETPSNAEFDFGADWGFSVDPTCLVRTYTSGRTLFIDHEVYGVGVEIDHTPAFFAGSDLRDPPRWINPKGFQGVPGATKWMIRADCARPETISYLAQRGFRIEPARKGAGSVEEGVEFLKSHDIVVHPRCRRVIDELSTYSYKVDKKTDVVLPVLQDGSDHTIDAIRYAVEARRVRAPRFIGAASVERVSPFFGQA
jgi:phage terminase large subunit